MKQNTIIKALFVVIVAVVGFILMAIYYPNTISTEMPQLVQKDAVTVHFEKLLAEYDSQAKKDRDLFIKGLEYREKVVRKTLEVEDAHALLQAEYHEFKALYATSTKSIQAHFDALDVVGATGDYDAVVGKMGINQIKIYDN